MILLWHITCKNDASYFFRVCVPFKVLIITTTTTTTTTATTSAFFYVRRIVPCPSATSIVFTQNIKND